MAQFRKPFPRNLQILGGASLGLAVVVYAIVQGFGEQRNVTPLQRNGLPTNLDQLPTTGILQQPPGAKQPLPATGIPLPTQPLTIPLLPTQPGSKENAIPPKVDISTQPIPGRPSNLQPTLTLPTTSFVNPAAPSALRSPIATPAPRASSPNLQPGELLPNLPDPLEIQPNPEPQGVPSQPPVTPKVVPSRPPVSAYGTPPADHLKLSPSQFSATPLLKPDTPPGPQPTVGETPGPDATPTP